MRIAYDYTRVQPGQPLAASETKQPLNTTYIFSSAEEPRYHVANPDWKVTTTDSGEAGNSTRSIHGHEIHPHDLEPAWMGHDNLMCSTVQHNRMAERIAFDADSIDRFAFILSHKLRAPVANALGLVELLGSDVVSDKEKKSCEDYLCAAIRQIDLEISKLNSILLEYRERIKASTQNTGDTN